jgi:hypothetical protein
VLNSDGHCIMCLGAVQSPLLQVECVCTENASRTPYAPLCVCDTDFEYIRNKCVSMGSPSTTAVTTTSSSNCPSGHFLTPNGICIECYGAIKVQGKNIENDAWQVKILFLNICITILKPS